MNYRSSWGKVAALLFLLIFFGIEVAGYLFSNRYDSVSYPTKGLMAFFFLIFVILFVREITLLIRKHRESPKNR
ncbi:hypothetical protein D3OALGA1CA_5700 [Olavius algarvensis associated proteobacterium Delta 3]|nr:hypothetical protein D3OALGA1CA_5700 [Olavius algarvensis associated proteobacterium Delta 3]